VCRPKNGHADHHDLRYDHIIGYAGFHLLQQRKGRRPFDSKRIKGRLRDLADRRRDIALHIRQAETAQKHNDGGNHKAAHRPKALMLDAVDDLYVLQAAGKHRGIGDHADVVPKAGAACDTAKRQYRIPADESVHPQKDRRTGGKGSPGGAGRNGQNTGHHQRHQCNGPGRHAEREGNADERRPTPVAMKHSATPYANIKMKNTSVILPAASFPSSKAFSNRQRLRSI
jgi:hypothetical protein